jgi:hypothetical protein
MKYKNIFIFFFLFVYLNSYTQNGIITYTAEVKRNTMNSKVRKGGSLSIKEQKEYNKFIDSQPKLRYKLSFNEKESIFKK